MKYFSLSKMLYLYTLNNPLCRGLFWIRWNQFCLMKSCFSLITSGISISSKSFTTFIFVDFMSISFITSDLMIIVSFGLSSIVWIRWISLSDLTSDFTLPLFCFTTENMIVSIILLMCSDLSEEIVTSFTFPFVT